MSLDIHRKQHSVIVVCMSHNLSISIFLVIHLIRLTHCVLETP